MELKVLRELIEDLSRLPGIGRKSAQRMAYYILKQPRSFAEKLSRSLINLKDGIKPCERWFNLPEDGVCSVCNDEHREKTVCVVEEANDVAAIERTGEFKGRYHVLNGVISPLNGIGPDNLTIGRLIERVASGEVGDVIIATNLTVEGEATAMYISRVLKARGARVFRIAHGLPVGGSLEYADEATMAKALEGRTEL